MLKIQIPSPSQIEQGRTHPFYSNDDGCLNMVDLSFLPSKMIETAESQIVIQSDYENQPVLIVTAKGSYLVQSDPLRLNEAPLIAVESPVLGVYPLYQMVRYRKPFDKEILNQLRQLIYKRESIIEL